MNEFKAEIKSANGGGAYIVIPFDVEEMYGKKRVKVKATFDGEHYRGSLVRMGAEYHIIGVRKDIRKKIGKDIGDMVRVSIEEDTEPRTVEVPDDLKKALNENKEAEDAFMELSYTHQKEYVEWINNSKKPDTRKRRIQKTVSKITQ